MSDFLNRLAARTLGLSAVVQPIVPTMFAPSHPLEGIDSLPEVVGEGLENPPEKTLPSADPGLPTLPEPGRFFIEPHLDELPMSRRPEGVLRPIPRLEVKAGAIPATGDEAAPPTPVVATHRVVDATPATATKSTDANTAAEPKPVDAMRQAPREIRTAVPRTVAPRPPKSLPAVVTREGSRQTPAARRDQLASPEPQTPVIRITIGRIDVRAEFPAPASPPARARPAQAATLSLDEYLKQRQEGKR